MAGSRKVGKGRGSVYAGGRCYLEGAEIPSDVKVGAHVFDDVEEVEGNVAVAPVKPVTADDSAKSGGSKAKAADADADGS